MNRHLVALKIYKRVKCPVTACTVGCLYSSLLYKYIERFFDSYCCFRQDFSILLLLVFFVCLFLFLRSGLESVKYQVLHFEYNHTITFG